VRDLLGTVGEPGSEDGKSGSPPSLQPRRTACGSVQFPIVRPLADSREVQPQARSSTLVTLLKKKPTHNHKSCPTQGARALERGAGGRIPSFLPFLLFSRKISGTAINERACRSKHPACRMSARDTPKNARTHWRD